MTSESLPIIFMQRIVLPVIDDKTWDTASDCLSKSRLVLFHKFCQLKYRKQYIEHSVPYEESHASTVGLRYHEWCERFLEVATNYDTSKWYDLIHPDFTPEEVPFLKWTIGVEIERYNRNPEMFTPIGIEYRIVDKPNGIRGIIDRIDQIDDETINVIEYKTSSSVNKTKLQLEFGFYDMLLDSIEELKVYKRKYTVYYPRFEKIVELNPSRRSTIVRKIDEIHQAIETDKWVPNCGLNVDTMSIEYATSFCTLCSLEEIAEWHGLSHCIRA